MPLEIARENEMVSKGKGKQPQRSKYDHDYKAILFMKQTIAVSSYYPGRGDDTHPLAQLDSQLNHNNHDTDVDDYVNETEEDWMGNDHIAKGPPSKFSESVAAEVHISYCFMLMCLI